MGKLGIIPSSGVTSLGVMPESTLPTTLYTAKLRRILQTASTISESSNRSVVTEAFELNLHGLRKDRSINVGISGGFLSEFDVEVLSVKSISL